MAASTHNTSHFIPPPPSGIRIKIDHRRLGLCSGAVSGASLAEVLHSALDTGHDDAVDALLESAEDSLELLDSAWRDREQPHTEQRMLRVLLRIENTISAARELHRRQVCALLAAVAEGGAG